MRSIDTAVVAEALFSIFSRVGFPSQVLCDNGSMFTSHMMKEVARLLSTKFIHTSLYHPMSNGLCEKWNGTLKRMLRRMSSECPKDWDRYLEPLMFAYREAPQESTQFSPFELLYGRTVRGPMSVLRELWTKEEMNEEVFNVYEYVIDLRNRLEATCQLASENIQTYQSKYKCHFDKKSKLRSLNVKDKVLILLPTEHNKLVMQWKGPFEISEKIGITDYRIRVGSNQKIYHINMMKQYLERSDIHLGITTAIVEFEDSDCLEINPLQDVEHETVKDVHVGECLTSTQLENVHLILGDFPEIFSDTPGCTKDVVHSIKLNTQRPINVRSYPIPFSQISTAEEEVAKMLQMGVIEHSNSAYNSPLLFVKKSDGSLRPVIDFRQLNKATQFDAEPIPNPENIFVKLESKKYFSKLDFCKGYWQLPMSDEDKEKTAFSTSRGLFQFRRMPFGLVNAGATYCRIMRKLLDAIPCVDSYIDDVLIHTSSWSEHMVILRQVFNRIKDAGLTVKPSKCYIGEDSIGFIGHDIRNGCLQTQPDKVDKVLNAEIPKTKTQIRAFLGLVGYYSKFLNNYAGISAPLSELTKKGMPDRVVWNEEANHAYETLKVMVSNSPVLRLPNFEKMFILRTDASAVGIGAILLQEHEGHLHAVAYASKKLSHAQQAYSTVERECLAIVWAVEKFYKYLYGRLFTIQTAHQPLAYLKSAKLNNNRLMRWALKLQPFHYRIEVIPGKNNIGADFLSRIVA